MKGTVVEEKKDKEWKGRDGQDKKGNPRIKILCGSERVHRKSQEKDALLR